MQLSCLLIYYAMKANFELFIFLPGAGIKVLNMALHRAKERKCIR